MLVHWFLERYAPGGEMHVASAAMKSLMQYDWPGNVRELENCVERAVALGNGKVIDLGDLPPSIAAERNACRGRLILPPPSKSGILDPDLADRRVIAEAPRLSDIHYRSRGYRTRHHPARVRTGQWRQGFSGQDARHQSRDALSQAEAVQHWI